MVCAARPGREMTRHANNTMSKRFSSGKGNKPVCGFGGFGRPYSAEANALARLAAVPSPCGVRHVPKLLGRDDARFELHFSNDGLTLSTPAARQALCALSRDDVMRQAECIDAHLALAGVRHLDMKYQGDNAALDAEGRISIIDFDISTVDDVPRLLKNCRFAYQKVSATTFFDSFFGAHCENRCVGGHQPRTTCDPVEKCMRCMRTTRRELCDPEGLRPSVPPPCEVDDDESGSKPYPGPGSELYCPCWPSRAQAEAMKRMMGFSCAANRARRPFPDDEPDDDSKILSPRELARRAKCIAEFL